MTALRLFVSGSHPSELLSIQRTWALPRAAMLVFVQLWQAPDYVVLLNPDTIVEPSSLKYLGEAGEQDTTFRILGGVP